ncbi:MAG: DNA translocase FtsK [Lachnospiraceae bacterium]|nr:DNA translocase FtsK [Lachnospiraceae bacterium]
MAAKKGSTAAAKRSSAASGTAGRRQTSGKKAASKKTTTRKKAGTGRSGSASSSKTPRQVREREHIDYAIYYEVVLWILLALAALLFLSMLGLGGMAGRTVSGFFFGLFGATAYIFPFLIFFIAAFLIANAGSSIARLKAFALCVLYLLLCGYMQLILVGYRSGYRMSEYYDAGAQYHTGGGLIGGGMVALLSPYLGIAGCTVILIILTIICLVLISQKSFLRIMGRRGSRIVGKARENREKRREWVRAQKAVRERKREEEAAAELEEPLAEDDVLPVTFSILPKDGRGKRSSSRYGSHEKIEETPSVQETEKKKGKLSPFHVFSVPEDEPEEENPVTAGFEPAAMGQLRLGAEKRAGGKGAAKLKTYAGTAPEGMPHEEDDPDDIEIRGMTLGEDTSSETEESAAAQDGASEDSFPETADTSSAAEGEGGAAKSQSSRRPKASAEEIREGISDVQAQIERKSSEPKKKYTAPPLSLLNKSTGKKGGMTEAELRETAAKLQQVFKTFGVNVKVTNVTCGPSVTRYELMPEMGVKVSRIVGLQDDIKLNLAAEEIRIEAPIPGKAAVGIEVPNKETADVLLRDLLDSDEFKKHPSPLAYAVGKDIAGNIIVSDIARMPHLLIAGATGSGKSVFINTLIMSIIYKSNPDDVKMILIDPKVVELSVYNGIPHLYIPVVTDPKKASGALNWAVAEMDSRYKKFAEVGARDIKGYNKKVEALGDIDDENKPKKMPRIVIIVDELADLMMVSSEEVEQAICRLAQLARAAGIHLVVATQRPSVDVITGLIKANMPSRIAFSVSSGVDSRTILDMIGAEKLLGNGDMLFAPQTFKQPLRVQGAFVSDAEVAAVADFLKEKNDGDDYSALMEERMEKVAKSASLTSGSSSDTDELFADAGKLLIEKDKASIGMLQRWFKIGFNRAARIMDQLSDAGVVGPEEGTKPRKVLMSMEEFENYLEQN